MLRDPLRLTIAICVLVIALTSGALAAWGPLWSSISITTPPPSGCGAVPAQAVAAGFTTCAGNFDFTATTMAAWLPTGSACSNCGTGAAVATLSNWLDANNTNDALPWHAGYFSNGPAEASVITDPVYGGQTLDMYYPSSQNTGSAGGDTGMGNQRYGGPTPGGFNFPNFYLETVARIDQVQSGTGSSLGEIFTWASPPYPASNPISDDMDEIYLDGVGDISWSQWQTGGGGFMSCGNIAWCGGFGSVALYNGWSSELPSYTTTAYQTYGALYTSDGASGVVECGWISNVFMGCVQIPSVAASQYNNRNWIWMQLHGQAGNTYNFNYLTRYIRVWSCANWATQQCNGTTETGTPPALTYYH
jgi:hypothetical protein